MKHYQEDNINPFKVGDKIICIGLPPRGHYQCALHSKATVSKVNGGSIITEEDICTSASTQGACYNYKHFKLDRPVFSFKEVIRSS